MALTRIVCVGEGGVTGLRFVCPDCPGGTDAAMATATEQLGVQESSDQAAIRLGPFPVDRRMHGEPTAEFQSSVGKY